MAVAKQENATKGTIDVVPAAVPGKLSRIDLVRQRKFWLVAMGATCIMTPGFGIKLLIGPQMYAVYQSSEDAESIASFMFLIAYSFMRLMTGVFADHFGTKPLFVIIGISQVASLALLGVCVFNGWPQAWAIALYAVVGLSLAGSKVLLHVWCLHLWGAANSGMAFGMTSIGIGVAAILGPMSAWLALCQVRMIDGIPLQGEQPELALAFAVWLWACSFLTAVGIICVAAVRASDQQAVAPHRNGTTV
jgi:MFS family permease